MFAGPGRCAKPHGVAMSDFNWSRDNGNVVLRAYGSIAVHENPYGDVVVRQERDALDDEDHWVVIPVQDAELVAQAIIDKATEIKREAIDQRQDKAEARQDPQPQLALPPPSALNGKNQRVGVSNG
jgi:hypothetical protein